MSRPKIRCARGAVSCFSLLAHERIATPRTGGAAPKTRREVAQRLGESRGENRLVSL